MNSIEKLFLPHIKPSALIELGASWSNLSRMKGLIAIEDELAAVDIPNPFRYAIVVGMQLVIDGADPEWLARMLQYYHDQVIARLEYRFNAYKIFLVIARKNPEAITSFDSESLLLKGHKDNKLVLKVLNRIKAAAPAVFKANDISSALGDDFKNHNLTRVTLGLVSVRDLIGSEEFSSFMQAQFKIYSAEISALLMIAKEICILIQDGVSARVLLDTCASLVGQDRMPPVSSSSPQSIQEAYDELFKEYSDSPSDPAALNVELSVNEMARRLELLSENPWLKYLR